MMVFKTKFLIKFKKYFYFSFITSIFFISFCSSPQTRNNDRLPEELQNNEKTKILKAIENFNNKAPKYIRSHFNLTSNINNKYFKFSGEMQYSKKHRKMYINLVDFIFKSPIASLFQDKNKLEIYLPKDKKIILDNLNNFSPEKYFSLDFNFKIIDNLLKGLVPMINKITSSIYYSEENFLIYQIENERYLEKIYFKNFSDTPRFPPKIILKDKLKKNITSFEIKDQIIKNNNYFKKIIIKTPATQNFQAEIYFKKTKFKILKNIKSLSDFKIPKNVKTISW